jgi:hypothetical protein
VFPTWIGAQTFWCGEKCKSWAEDCYYKDQYLQAAQTNHSGNFTSDTSSLMNVTQKVYRYLQVVKNVIPALLFILISFSIYCHTNMKSFRKLSYWLLMKQLLFRCRWWSLCLAHIWSSCLLLLMGMANFCFWWKPSIYHNNFFYSRELSILLKLLALSFLLGAHLKELTPDVARLITEKNCSFAHVKLWRNWTLFITKTCAATARAKPYVC